MLLLTVAGSSMAQMNAPLSGAAEPFSISPGSAFSASGGKKKAVTAAVASIAKDIREAERIILGNHSDAATIKVDSITRSALEGMLHTLDPHSNYHEPSEWKELLEEQHSGYTGIGATIGEFNDGSGIDTYILSAASGSAAAKAKLRFGDRIVSIEGKRTSGLGIGIVRELLRGDSGTTVGIVVERAATRRVESIVLQRSIISQPSIPSAFMIRPGVGYIELTEGFNHSTAEEFDRAMASLKRQGMTSLVIDLRWNGGGILEQAVKVTEKFLPAGTLLLSQRGRFASETRTYYSSNPTPETMPLVVLVNSRTASASEILAGALQDTDRALIVGEKTYGKGLVQTVIDLPGGAGLTLTTSRYLTPSGRSIQRDYSNVDLYDYYNHKTPSSGVSNAFFEARTATDRKEYGGDGIQPDQEKSLGKISYLQASLLDHIFFFARESADRRSAAKYPSASDDELASFIDRLTSTMPGLSKTSLLTESKFIRSRLNYYFAMALSGPKAADQAIAESDAQLMTALDAVAKAHELVQKAAKIRDHK